MIVVGSTACDRHVGCIIYSSLVAMELVCLVPALTRGKLCAAILFRYTSSQLGVRRMEISRRRPHHAPELAKIIQDRTIWNGTRRDGTTCDASSRDETIRDESALPGERLPSTLPLRSPQIL
jgi:hypothetical protein